MHFPNGLDANDLAYANHTKWTAPQWAWEFLRRNYSFRVDCHIIADQAEDLQFKLDTKNKYYLQNFVDYRQQYYAPQSPVVNFDAPCDEYSNLKPIKFKTDIAFSYANLSKQPQQMNARIMPMKALIEFDIKHAVENSRSLNAQINAAKKELKNLMELYSQQAECIDVKKQKNQTNYIKYLRFLDAHYYFIRDGKKNKGAHEGHPVWLVRKWIYAVIFDNPVWEKEKLDLLRAFDDDKYAIEMKLARDLSMNGYVNLASLSDKFPIDK